MKKQILLLSLMLSVAASAFGVEVEIDGLWYEVLSKTKEAKVIKYKNDIYYGGNIVIPEAVEYEGIVYNVTSIGNDAFRGCYTLHNVTISDGVITIGDYAFQDCNNLRTITFSNNLSAIGRIAFWGCSSLRSITIPKSLKSIGMQAFEGCRMLSSVHISDLEAWCNIDFEYGNPLEQAHHLFLNGEEIKELVIPEGVTNIRNTAFSGCTGLSSLTLSNSVTTIGHSAFQSCTGLITITIPSNVNSVGGGAFRYCSSLKSVCLQEGLMSVENQVFQGCSNLTSISIPNSVTSIGQWAFLDCSNLANITIGNGVEIVYTQAFANCPELSDVYCYAKDVPVMKNADPPYSPRTDAFEGSLIEYATLHVPESSIESYRTTEPWKNFKNVVAIMPKFTLTYVVDDEIYKSYQIEEGASIIPEETPTKTGYTFSGWSEIPETMPAHDVTVTGTFDINKYKLTYTVDGEEYKSYEIEYGASITGEGEPTKEGYTFSGWSEIPETMPAHDVTVTGTFNINKYKLTYTVDGEEYKSYEVEYGASITAEAAPTKEGYTFSGWSEIPETMPAHDVTVTGTFSINKYKLTYIVDGDEYKSYEIEYGATITPETEPMKEGYTFSGWSEIPETMPAHDVTVTGTFSINSYKLTYTIDGEEYKSYEVEYGATIMPEAEPTKEGYTFSGWSEIPETMPAHDVTVTGSFSINKYQITYIIDGEVFAIDYVEYGATIVPPNVEEREGFTFSGWADVPETMPAHDITIYGNFTSGIALVQMGADSYRIYTIDGRKVSKLQKGLNILINRKGDVKKVWIK